jgi:hypothetical protein
VRPLVSFHHQPTNQPHNHLEITEAEEDEYRQKKLCIEGGDYAMKAKIKGKNCAFWRNQTPVPPTYIYFFSLQRKSHRDWKFCGSTVKTTDWFVVHKHTLFLPIIFLEFFGTKKGREEFRAIQERFGIIVTFSIN